eukprot:CAMPEP_0197823454 /NCGR_PEP_ID=MMETSP1437-20131217/792_1 /TAXON_ID=49252 ORGANISM="Eucampia antarctica, Strain CCMP1452" /NCGR_SAMPLE_ID=MMETSP1437 /ASSEMBLY_ACC=CAM_ASM_001096 /LENGTH=283 /DNA_ID=CAMNT_0043422631 /DNA_START=70 /DNA_END=918 /DNA_ORIENTATION=+
MTYRAAVPPINDNKDGDPAVTLMLAGAEEAGYLPAEWSANVVIVEKTSTGPYATYGIWLDSLPKCLKRTYIVIATLLVSFLLVGPILIAIALLVTPKYRSVYRQYHESGEHIQGRVVEKRRVNNTRGERKWSTFAVLVQFHYPEDNTNSLPFQRQIPFTEAALLTAEETMELVCLPGRPESALGKSLVDFMFQNLSVYKSTVKPLFFGLFFQMFTSSMVSNSARNPNILRIGAIVGAIVTVVMLLLVWWQVPPEEQIICYLEKSGEPLPVNGPHEGPDESKMW